MNFSFYIFGTPNGYNQYPSDEKSRLFKDFTQNSKADSQLTIHRDGQLVYYAYKRNLTSGNSSNYLGFCLIFNGMYCRDTRKIFDVFDKVYNDVLLKGEYLRFDKSGKVSFAVDKFIDKEIAFERIKSSFQTNLDNEFKKYFVAIPSSFKVGNGTKAISIKEANTDIDAAIRQFDDVHVSNNEKSVSELERVYRMYAKSDAEKQDLEKKYKKLNGQKKQYKVVAFLMLFLLVCLIGLVSFNNSLKSRDNQIQSLEAELSQKKDSIANLHTTIINSDSTIAQLKIKNVNLDRKILSLKDSVRQKEDIIIAKGTEIQIINSEKLKLNNTVQSLKSEKNDLTRKNKQLSSEADEIKKSAPQRYKVIVTKAKSYRQCAGNFYEVTECAYTNGGTVSIYAQKSGYGLATGGWIKMSDLQKY
jgi:chromosome segregation ATPase